MALRQTAGIAFCGMSQPPYGSPVGPSAWPVPAKPSRLPLVLSIVAIVIGLVVGGIAVVALLKPVPKTESPAAKVYTEQEVADAKKAVCDAFDRGQKTLDVTGAKVGANPSDSFTVAVNSRVAIGAISTYWRSILQRHPATPNEIATMLSSLADLYENILLTQLGEGSRADLDALYGPADDSTSRMTQACK